MWSLIRWLVIRLAALRWLFKLGGLGLFLPIAFLLKLIGLPLLAILAVVGIPILILLFLFGLPVMLVLAFGSLMMGLLGVLISIGLAALKLAIFVVLPLWLVWMLVTRITGSAFMAPPRLRRLRFAGKHSAVVTRCAVRPAPGSEWRHGWKRRA